MKASSAPGLRHQLRALAQSRGRETLLYFAPGGQGKTLDEADLPVLFELVRRRDRTQPLDLVFNTPGGLVAAARRIAVMLRGYCCRLEVLVPQQANSAGTFLCLAADEIVLGPLSVLSPLDPIVRMRAGRDSALPEGISSEDVRALVAAARDWFGLATPAQRRELFAALTQKVFPTTVGALYRADRYVREMGADLLRWQLPRSSPTRRRRIIDALITRYSEHTNGLAGEEAAALGLRARPATPAEEEALWGLHRECMRRLEAERSPTRQRSGLIATVDAEWEYLVEWRTDAAADRPKVATACGWRRASEVA